MEAAACFGVSLVLVSFCALFKMEVGRRGGFGKIKINSYNAIGEGKESRN